jgi:hypothetical protein
VKITAESFTAELADVANQLQAFHNGQFQVVPRIHQRDFMGEAFSIQRGEVGAPELRREHLMALCAVIADLTSACRALNDVNEELRDLAERQCLDAASAIDLLNDIEWGRA